MAALPDSFDLAVRRAQSLPAARQGDFLLGTLFALKEWWLVNQGDVEKPVPAVVELNEAKCLIVFSDPGKLHDFWPEGAHAPRSLAVPLPAAADYCLEFRAGGVSALLVNPGEYAFTVTFDAVEAFAKAWKAHRARQPDARGFWIPNLTSEEEAFWEDHGL